MEKKKTGAWGGFTCTSSCALACMQTPEDRPSLASAPAMAIVASTLECTTALSNYAVAVFVFWTLRKAHSPYYWVQWVSLVMALSAHILCFLSIFCRSYLQKPGTICPFHYGGLGFLDRLLFGEMFGPNSLQVCTPSCLAGATQRQHHRPPWPVVQANGLRKI